MAVRADESLLPEGSDRGRDGRLRVAGCVLADLVEEIGTPAMLFDEAGLRETARRFERALRSRHPRSDVYFASKALPCPAIAGLFAEEGLGCDVASAGELAFARAGGVPGERMLLHGNAKTDTDVQAALDVGIGLIVLDSLDDLSRLQRLATEPQAVLVRVNPGVLAPTDPAMATGHADSKFGVPVAELHEMITRIETTPLVRLDGLHVHIGSQILDLAAFEQTVARLATLGLGAHSTYDLGGGLGVRYSPQDTDVPSIEEYAERLIGAVHTHLGDDCRIIVEPGRSLLARAGVTAYRVVTVKRGGPRTFVAVDGGMGDNLEPMLYGTPFAPFVLDAGDRAEETCDIVGPHCETGDRLVSAEPMARPEVGDIVVVPMTGAYCASLANNYNGMGRPPVVLCREGAHRVVTRRETIDDLLLRHVVTATSG